MFQTLVSLPKQAIFVLLNEKDKKAYVSFSSRLSYKLGSIVTEMNEGTWRYKFMTRDRKKLSLVILETSVQKHFVKYYKDEYRNNGYELYNESERIPLQYRFVINYTKNRVLVVAVNNNNDKEILGKFKTYDEARGFLLYIQHNNPANSLCYSIKR